MLAEMPAAAISLNELSRRAGMAKSNVLRYFESREAILLELATSASRGWIAELQPAMDAAIDPGAPPQTRAVVLADGVARTLERHPALCDLISAQAAVLEHNISTEAVLRHKRQSIQAVENLARLVTQWLPELVDDGAGRFVALLVMLTGTVWTNSHPPPAVVAAYDADLSLAPHRLNFVTALRDALEIVLAGLLAERPSRASAGAATEAADMPRRRE